MSNTNSNNGASPGLCSLSQFNAIHNLSNSEAQKENVLDVLNQLMSLNQMIVDQSAGKKKKFEGLGSRVAQIQKMATGMDRIFSWVLITLGVILSRAEFGYDREQIVMGIEHEVVLRDLINSYNIEFFDLLSQHRI